MRVIVVIWRAQVSCAIRTHMTGAQLNGAKFNLAASDATRVVTRQRPPPPARAPLVPAGLARGPDSSARVIGPRRDRSVPIQSGAAGAAPTKWVQSNLMPPTRADVTRARASCVTGVTAPPHGRHRKPASATRADARKFYLSIARPQANSHARAAATSAGCKRAAHNLSAGPKVSRHSAPIII